MDEYRLIYLRNAIEKGNAILLLGSGTSMGSRNRQGESVLSTKDLSKALAEESGFEYNNESLDEVYAASKQVLGSSLHRFLEFQFRHCVPSSDYINLAKLPWNRIYTTNIDDAFENAITQSTPASCRKIGPYMRSLHKIRNFRTEASCSLCSPSVRISHMQYS